MQINEIERLRHKADHDEAQALHNAEQKGRAAGITEIARNLLRMGMPLAQIAQVTGLTPKEIEALA